MAVCRDDTANNGREKQEIILRWRAGRPQRRGSEVSRGAGFQLISGAACAAETHAAASTRLHVTDFLM